MNYFHGGAPDLNVGDYILPPSITGAKSTASFGAAGVCDVNSVYISTDFNDALIFACFHPSRRGVVYEVEPEGEIMEDKDCLVHGLSFECSRAKILKVFYVPKITAARIRKIVGAA